MTLERNSRLPLMQMPVQELAALMKNKSVSPVELVKECLNRIEQTEPLVNAYISVLDTSALIAAEKAEREILQGRYRGPLHGIPYSAKDLYYTKGVRTTAGSAILAEHVPPENAAVIDRLETAGAILVGKNNLHEFAYGTTNENEHFGPCRNPWNLRMVTGGSSGGSAAAVAAGSAAFSLGTDTGGSIRIPASFCGVVGFKPTYGRVSKRGIIPLSWSMDHAGPLTKTVWDAAAVLTVMSGFDAGDPGSVETAAEEFTLGLTEPDNLSVKGLVIGICPQYYAGLLQPEVEQAFDRVITWFEQNGAILKELAHPTREAFSVGSIITMSEAYVYHERNLEQCGDKYGASIRYRLEKGQFLPASAYINAQRLRQKDRRIWAEIYQQVDVFLSPTVIMTAFPIGQKTVQFGQEAVDPRTNAVLMYLTSLADFNGLPVVSLPCGFTGDGLPIGFQVQGGAFAESKVFQVAYSYEQAHPDIVGRRCGLWK